MKIGYLNNTIQRIPIHNACEGYYLRWYYNGWHYWFFLPGKVQTRTQGEKYNTLGTQVLYMGSGQITYEQSESIRTIKNTKEIYLLTDPGWMNVRLEPGSIEVYNNQVDGYEIELIVIVGSRTISLTGYSPVIPPDVEPPNIDPDIITTQCIGTQQWMTKNYASNYPGSKVFDNNEANRAIYGGLYTYEQIIASGFCPVGYHVPTLAEWQQLIDYVGGNSIAGQKLKEAGIVHWFTGGGTNDVSFTALGAGYGEVTFGILEFKRLLQSAMFWTQTPDASIYSYIAIMSYDNSEVITTPVYNQRYHSVRLIKDTPCGVYAGYGALYNWYSAAGII